MHSRILLVFLQNVRKINVSKKTNAIENILSMCKVTEDRHQDAIWSVKTNIKIASDH
jgi:hypothetical protein